MLIKIGQAFIDPAEIAAITPDREDGLSDYERSTLICVTLRNGGSFWIDAPMDEAEAALIDAGLIESEAAEYMVPDLTADQHALLDALEAQGYEYVARNVDGKLFAYKEEPAHEAGYYSAQGSSEPKPVAGEFPIIDFAEAWSIPFLLGE